MRSCYVGIKMKINFLIKRSRDGHKMAAAPENSLINSTKKDFTAKKAITNFKVFNLKFL